MDSDDVAAVVAEVTTLVNEHYVDPAAAVQITRALAASLAGGRYAAMSSRWPRPSPLTCSR